MAQHGKDQWVTSRKAVADNGISSPAIAKAIRTRPLKRVPVVAETPRDKTEGQVLIEELQASGFIGLLKDRDDIGDSSAYVRQLREEMETRADRYPAEKKRA